MLEVGEAKAASIGIAYNIAVVDAGGALVTFTRQDGALIGSIDLAIGKAVTARIVDKAKMAQRGAPLFGIQETNSGRVVSSPAASRRWATPGSRSGDVVGRVVMKFGFPVGHTTKLQNAGECHVQQAHRHQYRSVP